MAQMIFTNDFTASEFRSDQPSPNRISKTFKKGDRAGISEQTLFGGQKVLAAIAKVNGMDVIFDVTNAPLVPYTQGNAANDGSGKSDTSLSGLAKFGIGVAIVIVIIVILKLLKVF